MKIVILVMFFMFFMPLILGTKVGEHVAKWLDNHFPNVEE